ncbi:low temperature requirement protein A [Actinomadura namibiensis]|uniref:low temperature requirement protein A n=1 Tax=Actinomadura kijaniata TaxID=46161 RepID=UPI00361D0D96
MGRIRREDALASAPHHRAVRAADHHRAGRGGAVVHQHRPRGAGRAHSAGLWPVAAGGLVTVFALWWVYFPMSSAGLLEGRRTAVLWGYGHYVIFASGAAVGAGIAVNATRSAHHAHVSTAVAGLALGVPVFLYLLTTWLLLVRPHGADAPFGWTMPLVGLLAVAARLTPWPVPVIGALMAAPCVGPQHPPRPRPSPPRWVTVPPDGRRPWRT